MIVEGEDAPLLVGDVGLEGDKVPQREEVDPGRVEGPATERQRTVLLVEREQSHVHLACK